MRREHLSELEIAAIEFIKARDAKAQAKAKRNAVKGCTEAIEGTVDDAGEPECWRTFNFGDDEEKLCDSCKERQRLHFEVNKLTGPAQSALARLRKLVRARG